MMAVWQSEAYMSLKALFLSVAKTSTEESQIVLKGLFQTPSLLSPQFLKSNFYSTRKEFQ